MLDIPNAFKEGKRFCVWRAIADPNKPGKFNKVPWRGDGSARLKWSNSLDLITYQEAVTLCDKGMDQPAYSSTHFGGIGYIIGQETKLVCIDLDDCVKDSVIKPAAMVIVKKLNSYTELSPSKKGLHIWFLASVEGSNIPSVDVDGQSVECFVRNHHVTLTGEVLEGFDKLEDRQEEFEKFYNFLKPPKEEIEEPEVHRVLYDGNLESKRRYVKKAIESEISNVRSSGDGNRNNALNNAAYNIAGYIHSGLVDWSSAEMELKSAARAIGLNKEAAEATILSGYEAGRKIRKEVPEPEPPRQMPPINDPEKVRIEDSPKKAAETMQDVKTLEKPYKYRLFLLIKRNAFELWHAPGNKPFITVMRGLRREHMELESHNAPIRHYIAGVSRDFLDHIATGGEIGDVITTLAEESLQGHEYGLFVRKAELNGKIYIDIGDEDLNIIEVSNFGWKIIKQAPVRFHRPGSFLPLAYPEKGGKIEDLKPLINARNDENWTRLLAWLTQAFWCKGSFAHLYLRGESGTAKSSMTRTLKTIIDPSQTSERSAPRDPWEMAVALGSESIPTFDNLSGVSAAMADMFCRAATGAASTKRALWTNSNEAVIRNKCAIIANGIESLGQRDDLLERTIILDLDPIPKEERLTEDFLRRETDAKAGQILGCILDMTAEGLANVDGVELGSLPRMADFAKWAFACLGPDLGFKFLTLYEQGKEDEKKELAESNTFADAIYRLAVLSSPNPWIGSASELLARLESNKGIEGDYRKPDGWPRSADAAGGAIRRVVSALESKGVIVKKLPRHDIGRRWSIQLFRTLQSPSPGASTHQTSIESDNIKLSPDSRTLKDSSISKESISYNIDNRKSELEIRQKPPLNSPEASTAIKTPRVRKKCAKCGKEIIGQWLEMSGKIYCLNHSPGEV